MRLSNKIRRWLGLLPKVQTKTSPLQRGRVDHIVILDGTMSTLIPGRETNAGLAYKLLCEASPATRQSLLYEKGVQWRNWRETLDVIEGRGINRQIRRAYGFIASRYRPGDRIFLIGYSRGAYAVRSLAGVIDRVGLVKAEHATERNIQQVYRHYQMNPDSDSAMTFVRNYCYDKVEIEMVGVWDTVKALGIHLPLASRLSKVEHEFHNHTLGDSIRHGFHALAMHERREAYRPILWSSRDDWNGVLEQVWFRGVHGDIGGQLGGYEIARPLANIPLVWMMEKVSECGINLPDDWKDRFHMNAKAPSVGTLRGWSLLFVRRRKRVIGLDRSEQIHPTAQNESDATSAVRSGSFS